MNSRILVIDDDLDNLVSTCALLEEWGYKVDQAKSGRDGLIKGASSEYAVILLDFRMPGLNGAKVAQEIKKVNTESIVLMYSCDSSREALKEAWAAGVSAFVDKDMPLDEFRKIIGRHCHEFEQTRRTVRQTLSRSATEELIASVGMVGRSTVLAEVARKIKKYQSSRDSVLIVGEMGSGKELVAAALHQGSKEKYKAVNSAVYKSSQLLDSELFGHEKGAFTGAIQSKMGILEAAQGGTVFFDELHQLDLDAQSKLLRVFQEKKIKRVGGRDEYPINFRIVAATQPHIHQRMKEGLFLGDLYYRVDVLQIDVPPLRDRPEDIEPLVAFFCEQYFEETGQRKYFLAETIRYFERYPWPGNIRELKNLVRKLLVDCNEKIEPKHLDKGTFHSKSRKQFLLDYSLLKVKQEGEIRDYIAQMLDDCHGNAAEAAARMNLPTSTFYGMMTKYGFKRGRAG